MPFDNSTYIESDVYRPGYLAPKKKNEGRGRPLAEEQRRLVLKFLRFTNWSIADTVRRSGVSDKTVIKIKREIQEAAAIEYTVLDSKTLTSDKTILPQQNNNPPTTEKKLPRFKDAQLLNNILCEQVRQKNADVSKLVNQHGFDPSYAPMIKALLGKNPKLKKIAQKTGFCYRTVRYWSEKLGSKTLADKKAIVIYELSKDSLSSRAIAKKASVTMRTVASFAARAGIQGQHYSHPKENAIRDALEAHPEHSSQTIADYLGSGFHAGYVRYVRRKMNMSSDKQPAGISAENLFLDAAAMLVKRHLESEQDSKLEANSDHAKEAGWMPLLEGKNPWPTSPESLPGCAIPKYRFLDAALTLYLREAGIEGPGHLKALTEKGFVRHAWPLPIFQALHFALAARDVTFDRLKIQQGPKQTWLPTRSQMIITAKRVLGCKK